ncbi:translocation and assembly module lipoprotein TamL [Brumimicrobium aurantiacum]|uniref:translocation and assembly module lipoprotein TamL n=1 Tax=Brumimicrobium aurantiacum TaxID=1737063 RepID=UPI000F4D803F|nr:BamA/TamA family outer membrane protein [Brumimicrobium aurantiacum]
MRRIFSYIILTLFIWFISACNITRNVPDGYYLLVSNDIDVPNGTEVDKDEIEDVIRQRPNHRTIGFRLRLRAFNTIDSTKAQQDAQDRLQKNIKKNKRRLARQEKINKRRIKRALKRGEDFYKPKEIELKDTIDPRPTFRERIKYEYGEAPVIYDSASMINSKEQIELFMVKKGYFDAKVRTEVSLKSEKKHADVDYIITPKTAYIVDSLFLRTSNSIVEKTYRKYLEEGENVLIPPFRFDSEGLGNMRKSLTDFMKNSSVYGFKESYISFEVDTLGGNDTIQVAIDISKRIVGKDENERVKPFVNTRINEVVFHLMDTLNYPGNFQKEQLDPRGIKLGPYEDIPTFDTLRYDWYDGKNEKYRTATFLYNGKLTTKPELIEFQNYLEENNYYKGDYVSQSYNRLMNLNIFKTVRPELIENDYNTIDVHYYLTPLEQRTFSFEPKATHSNSFLGVSTSLNYINRNLYRSGNRLKISFSGGFESLPDVFSTSDESKVINDETRSLNTIEFGPSFELELPGLYPIGLKRLSKNQNPVTTFSGAYSYQQRPEFKRQTIQVNYLWKFYDIARSQLFTVGIPVIGGIQFVRIDKTESFEERLEEQNDLFLINAYSNQAIYKDVALNYSYNNPNLNEGKMIFNYGFSFDVAGMAMSLITQNNEVNENGYKEFLGQRYSQFVRLDNNFTLHQYLNEKSFHYRLQVGAGVPLENNGPSLPFDYSFFGGGSNDNRGFRARSLGPGVYKYYLDSNSTVTEMGDMRLGASAEFRFKVSSLIEGAIFSDAGNVWTYNEDVNRSGGQITTDFYKQMSVSGGLGVRLDFSFLIVRLDFGIPLRNPALPDKAKWIFQSRDPYYQEAKDEWGIDPNTGDYYYKNDDFNFPKPFQPQIHIAIGYPF